MTATRRTGATRPISWCGSSPTNPGGASSQPGATRSAMDQGQLVPQPAEAGRAVLRDEYDTEKLAPEHKRLLDQAQPLPGDVGFFPRKPSVLKLIGALGAVVVLALCGVLAFIGSAALVGPTTTVSARS